MDLFEDGSLDLNIFVLQRMRIRLNELEALKDNFAHFGLDMSWLGVKIRSLRGRLRNGIRALREDGHEFEIDSIGSSRASTPSGEHCDLPDNPLLNYLILDRVLDHLKPEELLPCRLVCSLWRDRVNPQILSRFPPKIFVQRPEILPDHGQGRFLDLIDLMCSSPAFPWVSFNFTPDFLAVKNEFLLRRFFDRCSHRLHHLSLTISSASDAPLSGLLHGQIFWALRSLEINLEEANSGIDIGSLLISIGETAPKLEKLSLKGIDFDVEVLEDLQKVPLGNLKVLELPQGLSPHQIQGLIRWNLPAIKDLAFSFTGSENIEEFSTKFLVKFASNLEVLTLEDPPLPLEGFPTFRTLKSIHIKFNGFPSDLTSFFDEKKFPKLKNVGLEFKSCFGKDKSGLYFLETDWKCVNCNVTSLKIDAGVVWSVLKPFGTLFPNLRVLWSSFGAGRMDLEGIWNGFPGLEDLTIVVRTSETDLDKGLTGYSEGEVEVERIQDLEIGKSIAELKKLKRLKLDMENSRGFLPILGVSDVTGYFLYHHLPKLESLTIGPSRISKECIQKISERFIVMQNTVLLRRGIFLLGDFDFP